MSHASSKRSLAVAYLRAVRRRRKGGQTAAVRTLMNTDEHMINCTSLFPYVPGCQYLDTSIPNIADVMRILPELGGRNAEYAWSGILH
jgi:hypothetical protein